MFVLPPIFAPRGYIFYLVGMILMTRKRCSEKAALDALRQIDLDVYGGSSATLEIGPSRNQELRYFRTPLNTDTIGRHYRGPANAPGASTRVPGNTCRLCLLIQVNSMICDASIRRSMMHFPDTQAATLHAEISLAIQSKHI